MACKLDLMVLFILSFNGIFEVEYSLLRASKNLFDEWSFIVEFLVLHPYKSTGPHRLLSENYPLLDIVWNIIIFFTILCSIFMAATTCISMVPYNKTQRAESGMWWIIVNWLARLVVKLMLKSNQIVNAVVTGDKMLLALFLNCEILKVLILILNIQSFVDRESR